MFAPEYIFMELEKHKDELLEKTERTTEELFKLVAVLQRKITIVALEELVQDMNSITFIEWPNLLEPLLKTKPRRVIFEEIEIGRKIIT